MTHPYQDNTEDLAKSYRRIHGNGEETHVHILSCGEDRYLVLAGDVDPRDYSGVAGEIICYEPTLESAHEKATAWMEQNPKGIAEQSGKGRSRIMTALQKLNNYGNSLADQNQQDQEGQS